MLNRQKVLIEMLREAGRPVSKLELVKWAFMLREETTSNGGASFYDFVPYHYGPYSFVLSREIEALAAMGFVRERGQSWELGPVVANAESVPRPVARDASRVVNRFRAMSIEDLIEYVYCGYPAFTVNSKRKRLAPRPSAQPAVFTAGYEGLQVDGFLNLLVRSGIERLIDVRRNPVARRYGFHRGTLHSLTGSLGIAYEHVPELGIASEKRRSLETAADYAALFDDYELTTLTSETKAVERVARLIVEGPSVLVCMEADHRSCHRDRLAAEVAGRTGLPVVHLKAPV